MVESDLPLFKLILIGDSGVGKTCIVSQFVDHMFDVTFINTIGKSCSVAHPGRVALSAVTLYGNAGLL